MKSAGLSIHGGGKLNKDRVKGAVDQVVGSTKRNVGEITGNTRVEIKGGAQQIKGKIETAVGKVKDAVHHAADNAAQQDETSQATKRANREVAAAGNRNLL
jgi:uncharacterized protein YjbJ (UPF0337 family)